MGHYFLQGLTALTFVNEAYKVQKDDYILVWAAVGGVGKILVQLISHRSYVIAAGHLHLRNWKCSRLSRILLINSTSDDIVGVKEINGEGVVVWLCRKGYLKFHELN